MYNRYMGNTGRVERVDDGQHSPVPQAQGPDHLQERRGGNGGIHPQHRPQRWENQHSGESRPRPVSAPGPVSKRPPSPLTGISGELGRLLSRLSPMNLETDDLILAMILYLMYRDSRDEELLYIMAAMFLL